ncbi:MAG: ABC transporter ATP-binding protein [Candidatus Electrothrix sp. AW3_4]|nr:ABC transporter ATP-binding protein [Candidatus Electrothrix gigas]
MTGCCENTLLAVRNLSADFPGRTGVLDRISFSLYKGEVLGIIGESGSGKSVLARTLLRLEAPARITAGSILLDGQDLAGKSQQEMRAIRGRKIALAVQDPRSAMDPVFRMESQLLEVMQAAGAGRQKSMQQDEIYGRLSEVGISSPRTRCRQYPHQWSRGMLQRAQLVMLFSTNAQVLILDEVTSALDPTVTLEILDLIRRLQQERKAGIILITHDTAVARELCDRAAVMQQGRMVESGPVAEVLGRPTHPYTRELVAKAGC